MSVDAGGVVISSWLRVVDPEVHSFSHLVRERLFREEDHKENQPCFVDNFGCRCYYS